MGSSPEGNLGQRVRLLCSYGGRVRPRAHDRRLAYHGGETKMVAVDRSVRFAELTARLAGLPPRGLVNGDFQVKYQLPGQDLDVLVSVADDEDVENMMLEYDGSSPATRLRLFLFDRGLSNGEPDRRLLADFLNSAAAPPPASLPDGEVPWAGASDASKP